MGGFVIDRAEGPAEGEKKLLCNGALRADDLCDGCGPTTKKITTCGFAVGCLWGPVLIIFGILFVVRSDDPHP